MGSLIPSITFFQKRFFKEGIVARANKGKCQGMASHAKSLPNLLACITTKGKG